MESKPVQKWDRIILHADMDAFFASVEQRDNPDLAGLPVVVGGLGKRGVVAAASYEAREYSIKSAMPMVEARRRCPDAVFLAPRFSRYKDASAGIMTVLGEFSPLVEPLGLDEAFLDMTGSENIFGDPLRMARMIKVRVREETDLTVSVGASNTKFTAKTASDHHKPDGITIVPPDEVKDFLSPLPLSKLWGVGPKTVDKLVRLGFKTIGDVASADAEILREGLGALGSVICDLARGIDPRKVEPQRDRKSVGAEFTLESDVKGAAAIRPHLRRAADETARRLREKGLRAHGVRVKLKTRGFKLYTRQAALRKPTDSADDLFSAGVGLLDEFNLKSPMRLVGLAAFDLLSAGEPVQGELFSSGGEKRKLEQTMDTLREKFGENAIKRGREFGKKTH